MLFDWWRLGVDLTLLAAEAQSVITLRLLTLAAGGSAAQTELSLMTAEKVLAAAGATWAIGLGYPAHDVVRSYRRHVQPNLQRLQAAHPSS